MKLLFCKQCQDIIKLETEERKCKCGEVKGRYLDILNAEYSGENALPLGIDNQSLSFAIKHPQIASRGTSIDMFVILEDCETMTKIK